MEILRGFLNYNASIFMVSIIFAPYIGILLYVVPIITTVILYNHKKKFIWLSMLFPTIIGTIIFSSPFPNRSLLNNIIDILLVLSTLIFQSGILVLSSRLIMLIKDKIKKRA